MILYPFRDDGVILAHETMVVNMLDAISADLLKMHNNNAKN